VAEVLTELAKASPFTVMCILMVWLIGRNYNKNLEEMRKANESLQRMYESQLKEIRGLYENFFNSIHIESQTKLREDDDFVKRR